MKLREFNRWFVSLFGLGQALQIPLLVLFKILIDDRNMPPGAEVLALVWTVLAVGCVVVLLFDVPLPPGWRMAAALWSAAAAGLCVVYALVSPIMGFTQIWFTFVLSGIGLAVIAVGMAGTVLHPECVRDRRSA